MPHVIFQTCVPKSHNRLLSDIIRWAVEVEHTGRADFRLVNDTHWLMTARW